MGKPNELFKAAGDVLGVLGGGRRQVDAVGLSAKAGQVAAGVRSDLLAKITKAGETVGAHTGSDFFEAFFYGAKKSAGEAVTARERELVGTSREDLKSGALLIGLAILAGLLLLKR